jgi:hypothetical protein
MTSTRLSDGVLSILPLTREATSGLPEKTTVSPWDGWAVIDAGDGIPSFSRSGDDLAITAVPG